MAPAAYIYFPPFRLDVANEQLWCATARGDEVLPLRPKTFAVLRYLLEHCQQLVTKDRLLNALWPDTMVTDSALKSCVRELRKALHETPQAPRFIATVHRRGYRFLTAATLHPDPSAQVAPISQKTTAANNPVASTLHATTNPERSVVVGREAELACLHELFAKAVNGERQVVFITGEPGIGKSSLVDTFVQSCRVGTAHQQEVGSRKEENQKATIENLTPSTQYSAPVFIAWGQCIEHYGVGEPYLPICEALGRLCRGPAGNQIIDILDRYAPTWLAQMPTLRPVVPAEERYQHVAVAPQERRLQEMAEAIEVIAAHRPCILLLEDLHWSDSSTLELLTMLARRREPARLLILATYRPADVARGHSPLVRVQDELQLHGDCHTLPLRFLTRAHIAAYLSWRFPQHAFAPAVAEVIHRQTEGNPLFMVSIVEELVRQARMLEVGGQWIVAQPLDKQAAEVPITLAQTLARQIEDLTPSERRMLEAASAIDVEFSSAAVAAVLAEDIEAVEISCDTLIRQSRFLQSIGLVEGPDGAIAARYRFIHALHREVLYSGLAVNARIRLHRRIRAWLERTYGHQTPSLASELALHCERGHEYQRAVRYHQQAGKCALQRSAHTEALVHFEAGLRLLHKLPVSKERNAQELALHIARAAPLGTMHGYGSVLVEEAYECARLLCRQVRESPQIFPVLAGLVSVLHMRGKLLQAQVLEDQLLRIAQRAANHTLFLWTYFFQGATAYHRGQLLLARKCLETALPFYDPHQHNPQASNGREDPGLLSQLTLASTLWLLGYPDQALQTLRAGQILADQSADPVSQAMVLGQAAVLHQRRRDAPAALAAAERFLVLTQEQGFSFRAATGKIYHGWALAACGHTSTGLAQLRTGLDAIEATGTNLARPYYLALLSEVYSGAAQCEEALLALHEALTLAHANEDQFYEAELWRLRGELFLIQAKKSASSVRAKRRPKSNSLEGKSTASRATNSGQA